MYNITSVTENNVFSNRSIVCQDSAKASLVCFPLVSLQLNSIFSLSTSFRSLSVFRGNTRMYMRNAAFCGTRTSWRNSHHGQFAHGIHFAPRTVRSRTPPADIAPHEPPHEHFASGTVRSRTPPPRVFHPADILPHGHFAPRASSSFMEFRPTFITFHGLVAPLTYRSNENFVPRTFRLLGLIVPAAIQNVKMDIFPEV